MKDKGRILCIDYGEARIGVAISDPTRTIAQAREHIANNCGAKALAAKIAGLASDSDAGLVVFGLPRKLDGSDGGSCTAIRALAAAIKDEFNIETALWDERFSTVSAENILIEADMSRKKRKEKIDSLSALIILQNYLDFLSMGVDER